MGPFDKQIEESPNGPLYYLLEDYSGEKMTLGILKTSVEGVPYILATYEFVNMGGERGTIPRFRTKKQAEYKKYL